MTLKDLAKKLRDDATRNQTGLSELPVGTLTLAEFYPQLRYGDVEGIGTVEIDQTGNMVGFSPVERCSAGGETAWIPLELIRNIRWQPFGFTAGTPHAPR